MKTNYSRFALLLLMLVCGTATLVFVLVGVLVIEDFDWNQNSTEILQTIGSVGLVVWAMSLVLALPSFIVKIDSSGVRQGFRSKNLPWSDIVHVKIFGLSRTKQFNRIVFGGYGQAIEINLFIFDDQEEAIEGIKAFLPWAASLDMTRLPSEASKFPLE